MCSGNWIADIIYSLTVVHHAIQEDQSVEEITRLLDHGVDINAIDDRFGTPLAAAAFNGSRDIVSLLLEQGADIDAVGGEYGTALAAAASQGKMQMVSLLLDHLSRTHPDSKNSTTTKWAPLLLSPLSTSLLPFHHRHTPTSNLRGSKNEWIVFVSTYCVGSGPPATRISSSEAKPRWKDE